MSTQRNGSVRRAGGRSVMSGDIWEDMLGWERPAPTSTYLVRAEAARQIGGFDETLTIVTDRDFLFRLSMRWRVAVVQDVLMLMHEGQHARTEQRPGALEGILPSISSPTSANSNESLANAPRRSPVS